MGRPMILNVRVNPGRHSAALILDKFGNADGGGVYIGSITMTGRQEFTAKVSQSSLRGVAGIHGRSIDQVMAELKRRGEAGTIRYSRNED